MSKSKHEENIFVWILKFVAGVIWGLIKFLGYALYYLIRLAIGLGLIAGYWYYLFYKLAWYALIGSTTSGATVASFLVVLGAFALGIGISIVGAYIAFGDWGYNALWAY